MTQPERMIDSRDTRMRALEARVTAAEQMALILWGILLGVLPDGTPAPYSAQRGPDAAGVDTIHIIDNRDGTVWKTMQAPAQPPDGTAP